VGPAGAKTSPRSELINPFISEEVETEKLTERKNSEKADMRLASTIVLAAV